MGWTNYGRMPLRYNTAHEFPYAHPNARHEITRADRARASPLRTIYGVACLTGIRLATRAVTCWLYAGLQPAIKTPQNSAPWLSLDCASIITSGSSFSRFDIKPNCKTWKHWRSQKYHASH